MNSIKSAYYLKRVFFPKSPTVNIRSLFIRFLTFLILLISVDTNAQESKFSIFSKDSIDNYIIKAMREWGIPGISVVIIKDGEIFLEKGYGITSINSKKSVTSNTIFPIASVTKSFTGTIMATLEADGKISMDDLVTRWLPWFSMKDELYSCQLTLTDILSHRSGWKTFQGDLLNTESSMDFRTMVEKFSAQRPAYPIRTKFGYSNFGFMIAGLCIQNITGKSWNEYLKERILTPLGMKRTLADETDIKAANNVVTGHTNIRGNSGDSLIALNKEKIEPFSHGGIYSTSHDLGIWIRTLLNGGVNEGDEIIPKKAIDKAWSSHTIVGKSRAADREFYLKTYGLGWEIIEYNGFEILQHGGAYAGGLSMLAMIPSKKFGIAILTNHDDHLLQETLKWQMIDAIIGREAPDYTAMTIKRQRERRIGTSIEEKKETGIDKPSKKQFITNISDILGTYKCDYYGDAYIDRVNNKIILTLQYHPTIKGEITVADSTNLICNYNHPMFGQVTLPFEFKRERDKSGKESVKVLGFKLFVDPFIESDGYSFKFCSKP